MSMENLIRNLNEENLKTNIILNDEKLNVFTLISGTRQEYPFSLLPFSIILEVLASTVKQKKHRYTDKKEETKLSLFANYISM